MKKFIGLMVLVISLICVNTFESYASLDAETEKTIVVDNVMVLETINIETLSVDVLRQFVYLSVDNMYWPEKSKAIYNVTNTKTLYISNFNIVDPGGGTHNSCFNENTKRSFYWLHRLKNAKTQKSCK